MKRPEAQITDAGAARIKAVLGEHPAIPQDATRSVGMIESEIFHRSAGSTLGPEQAAPLLTAWMSALSSELALLLSAESRLFWLFMHRRIGSIRTSYGESHRTELLHDEYATLAILRYGRATGTEFRYVESSVPATWFEGDDPQPLGKGRGHGGFLLPSAITKDQVEAAFLLDRLTYAFWACAVLLRRVWKGASLTVSDEGRVNPIQPARLERLIQLYDRRTDSTPLLAHAGLHGGPELKVAAKQGPALYMWLLHLNREAVRLPLRWAAQRDQSAPTYQPRFLLLLANLDEYLAAAEPFREEIEARTGSDPWAVACLIASLSAYFLDRWRQEPERTIQYESFGYGTSVTRDVLLHYLPPYFEMYAAAIGLRVSDARSQVDALLHTLSFEEAKRTAINVWVRSGRYPFIPTDYGFVCDLQALVSALHASVAPIPAAGKAVGYRKGMLFESQVIAAMRRVRRARVLLRNREVRGSDGMLVGEVDAGVVRADTLFILECKAHSVHPTWETGTPEALRLRWETNQLYLRQVTDLAKAVATGRTDVMLPPGVRKVISIVVSPFPDYIPELDEEYFLTSDIPRICTVSEVADFLSKYRTRAFERQTWICRVGETEGR